VHKWLQISSDFTSSEKAKARVFHCMSGLISHDVIMGKANKKYKQLH
jgi:hypothetical protein